MDGVLMFLCFLCIPVFFVSLVMLVVRLITRRKPWKPCAKAAVLSVIGFFMSAGVGNYLDNAQKKQNALSANPPAAVADSAVDVDNPVHIVRLPYKNLGVRFVLRRNVAYEATACSSPAPAPAPSPVPAAAPRSGIETGRIDCFLRA